MYRGLPTSLQTTTKTIKLQNLKTPKLEISNIPLLCSSLPLLKYCYKYYRCSAPFSSFYHLNIPLFHLPNSSIHSSFVRIHLGTLRYISIHSVTRCTARCIARCTARSIASRYNSSSVGITRGIASKPQNFPIFILNTYRRSFPLLQLPRISYGATHIKPLSWFLIFDIHISERFRPRFPTS